MDLREQQEPQGPVVPQALPEQPEQVVLLELRVLREEQVQPE